MEKDEELINGHTTPSEQRCLGTNENSNHQTRTIFELFHLSYYRWVRLKGLEGSFQESPC